MTTDGPPENRRPPLAEDGPAVHPDGPSSLTASGAPSPTVDVFLRSDSVPRTVARSRSEKARRRSATRPRRKPVSVLRRIRTVVAYILLLAVLGAAGIAAVGLVEGNWMITPVLSGSMRPGLSVGGVVVSERVPVASLHVRDVIIFRDPYKISEQIVHRIVKILKAPGGRLLFDTQGDANNVRDPWTLSIVGTTIYRARWAVPLVGYLAIAYQDHRGFFLLGAGIVLVLIALSVLFEERQRRGRHLKGAGAASAGSNGPTRRRHSAAG